VANILWVNFSLLGVVSAGKLAWVADYVAAELHGSPSTSVAILSQSNRSYDETRASRVDDTDAAHGVEMDAKSEHSGSDSEDHTGPWDGKTPQEGSARMGHARSLRAGRHKIEEVFSEVRRGLNVDNAQMVFDPTTVWGNRNGCHNMLIITPRSVPPSSSVMRGSGFSNHAAMRSTDNTTNPSTHQHYPQ